MGYSIDLKMRAAKAHINGKSVREVAALFEVGHDSVSRWAIELKNTGTIENKTPDRSHLRKVTEEKVEAVLMENPTASQVEIAEKLGCTPQSVCVALIKFSYSKKSHGRYIKSDVL